MVDRLERKYESVVRPRRCNPREMLTLRDQYCERRANDLYRLYPLDTPDGKRLRTFLEHCAFNDNDEKKGPSTHPLPTIALLMEWRDRWTLENPPKTEEENRKDEAEIVVFMMCSDEP